MSDYQLIKQVFAALEEYEGKTSESVKSFEGFVAWLAAHGEESVSDKEGYGYEFGTLEGSITVMMAFMYRYAAFYTKRVFKHSPIYSMEDFGFLASLYPLLAKPKLALIQENLMEKSSGNEVIKRLIRQGLLSERPNPDDKRSKLVELTKEGKMAFERVQTAMQQLSGHITGDLNSTEKLRIYHYLQRLHTFHWPFFRSSGEESLQKLIGIEKGEG